MGSVTRFFIGVDLHKTIIQICVLDHLGNVLHEKRFLIYELLQGAMVFDFLEPYRSCGRVAVEAIGLNRWFVNGLLERGFDVVVCDPAKLNLKMLGKKTDRKDALEIARRLLLGDIDRNALTYYPNDEQYGKRRVVRARHKQVQMRQEIINQIRAQLNAYKITDFEGGLTGKKIISRLSCLELGTQPQTDVLQSWISLLISCNESIALLDQSIKKIASEPLVKSVQNMLPNVGPLTASALVYELGDVTRFRNSRAVASFCGVVPRVNQSADKAHHGRLTKRGSRGLRHILGEWAVRLMSSDELVIKWAKPRLKRSHKNKVRMALARRLVIGVYKMLLTGEVFSMRRCLA